MANTALIVFMSMSVVLLFGVMVMTSVAANNSDPKSTCHNYSKYAAITTGITSMILIAGTIIYVYTSRSDILQGTTESVGDLHSYLKGLNE